MATLNTTLVVATVDEHGIQIPNSRHVDSEKVTTSSSAPGTVTAPTGLANGRKLVWMMTMDGGSGWVKFGTGAQTAVSGVGHYLREGVEKAMLATPGDNYAVIDA